jgi:hypothetical protein
MKTALKSSLAAALLLATAAAQAWTYQDGDVLLIFRESGFNDVEFDLGPVSQFLGQTNGYTAAVTNWDLSLVTGVFGADLSGADVVLVATTPPTNANPSAWLSSSIPNLTAYGVTPSAWQGGLWSTINAIGTRPVIYEATASGSSAYSIDPSGSQSIASYDQIVSQDGVNAEFLPEFGGNSKFTVQTAAPGSFYFWSIDPSTVNPKPADSFVGTFTITTNGQLTFVAGPPPPALAGIGYASGTAFVNFGTIVGGNYWLASTNALGAPLSQWPVVGGPIAGTGGIVTVLNTNTGDTGFYGVIRTP